MATSSTTSTSGVRLLTVAALTAILAASALLASFATSIPHAPQVVATHRDDEYDEEGEISIADRSQEPDALELAFARESYRPGAIARLGVWTSSTSVELRIYRIGAESQPTVGNKELQGVPVTAVRRLASIRRGQTIAVPIGDWPSGLYFARATSPRRTGFAPFVVRPTRLGEHRVAVVLPTRTWQAYNFRDDDGDGQGDTWYATRGHLQARLHRPFLNRGVPPHFRSYDLRFLHWLHDTGRSVDVLSQAELDGAHGETLAAAYDLIVFPGHHEYVTRDEYDAVRRFRDLGGNLAFLSANNFFWRIDLRAGVLTRVAKWRELGRPEAGLLGVQYIGNDMGEHRGPWLVRAARATTWLFSGVKLRHGREFSDAGIEIDAVAPSSPPGTQIVAEIPDLLGPGMTAHMAYYETKAGARVFAAGAFSLARSVRQPAVRRLLDNLWARLTVSEAPASGR
jgi:hypothetical protein